MALTGWSSLLVVVLSVMFLTAYVIAWRLIPDPTGSGTHKQLGLPPCTIQTLFGFPCPTCGMTTSFAHFVRGEWVQAARANASGLILACFGALFLPWAAVSLMRKEYWLIRQPDLWSFGILIGWMSVTILEWTMRHYLPRFFGSS